MSKLSISYQKLDEIKPNEVNPRNIQDAIQPVANSIKEFGFLNPIVLNQDNTILAGHVRLEAAKLLGMDEVPTVQAGELSEAQQKAFLIADNKLNEAANFDTAKLAEIITDLEGLEFDLELTGFDDLELDNILDTSSSNLHEASEDITMSGILDEEEDGKPKKKKKDKPQGKIERNVFLMDKEQHKGVWDAISHKQKTEANDLSNSEALYEICDFYLRSMGE